MLYISSYSPSLFTFDEQQEGIRSRFINQPIKLDAEYMDSKNFNTQENLENFKNSLQYKLENGKRYDAVIVGDDNGLVFLMQNKAKLFPATPIFFLGINNLELAIKSNEHPMVTGVVEAKSIVRTIELANQIQPNAKRVVSLVDRTPSSQGTYADLVSKKDYFPQLEFMQINMSDGTFDEFYEKLSTLDKTDILFGLSPVTDKDGNVMDYDVMLQKIVDIAPVPMYGFTSYGIGDGIFGGCVISHVDQGYAAADMVMQYFHGTSMEDIPFSTKSPNAYMIDYQLFMNYGFSLNNLPEDTVLVNRTYTLWEQFGKAIILGVLVIIIESFIIFFLITNIQKRRRTASALRANEKKFRSYIENAPDGIFIVNDKGELLDVNEAACRISGYNRAELLNLTINRLLQKEFNSNMEIDGHSRDELQCLTKSGEKRFWSLETVKLSDTRFLVFAKDITERKEAQEKKRVLENQLHHSQKMDAVGQLASGVAHDFNNILGAIMGATQILQSPDMNPDEETQTFLDMIMTSSLRAADLNSKLLAFCRKGKISSTALNLNDILDDTLAILGQTIDKGVEIICEKGAGNSRVVGDNSALQSSLLNLCINGSQAMPLGGKLSITTRNVSLDENYCLHSPFEIEAGEFIDIEIRDTGTGISQENIKKIYEPFFTTKEAGKGTGLGLAAVYGTVQDHGGAISVHSEVGVGTVFHLKIPCSESEKTTKETLETVPPGAGLILLVDDEEFIRITGKYTLEEMGYNVILAGNGVEAVEIFRNKFREIDLVLMDMIMPKMNGSEAFKLMKQIDEQCKVVIASGFTKDEKLSELKKQGLLGFIQKPYKNKELLKLMSEVIGD